MAGWVYIISNKAMPGILKIGYTERSPIMRAYELYHTGCPYPYQVDYYIYVDRPYEVEQKSHELQRKTNVGKEWFSCSFEEGVSTINDSIKLIGAIVDINRKPPELTPNDITTIIQGNPAVEGFVKADLLSIKIDNQLLIFHTISQKKKFEEELFRINSIFSNKMSFLQEEYKKGLTQKTEIDSLGAYIARYLFHCFWIYIILIFNVVNCVARIFGICCSRKDQLYVYAFFVCVSIFIVLAICRREIKKHELNEYKNTPFNLMFKEKVEECEQARRTGIRNLKNKFNGSYDITNLN